MSTIAQLKEWKQLADKKALKKNKLQAHMEALNARITSQSYSHYVGLAAKKSTFSGD